MRTERGRERERERERESLLGAILGFTQLGNWVSKASSVMRPYAVGEGSCRNKTSRCKPRKGMVRPALGCRV